jgi:hypothetical protein
LVATAKLTENALLAELPTPDFVRLVGYSYKAISGRLLPISRPASEEPIRCDRQLGSNYRLMPSRFSDVRSDGVNVWDLSAIKNTRIRETVSLQFRGEFLNAFNHALFSNPNTTPTSTAFGTVTSQRGYPRRIQLGMKLLF